MATSTLVLSSMASPFSTNSYPASSSTATELFCPQCGYHLPHPISSDPAADASEANRRIRDLEAQVKLLNSKAAAAVDKLADYEDEIQTLRDAYARSQQQGQTGGPQLEGPGPTFAISSTSPQQQNQQPPQQQSRLASLSAFLPGRRKESNANLPATPATATFPPTTNPLSTTPKSLFSGSNHSTPVLQSTQSDSQVMTLSSLQSTLEEERAARLRAESSLSQTQTELEELTAQLFGQANEMVATERKARAKLEERVRVLEQRDVEKRKRLERLEKAVTRIERVREMIGS